MYHCTRTSRPFFSPAYASRDTIGGIFIPVSSLKVFGHSIHSERRRIYLGDQYMLFKMTPLSYHDYSVSGSSSQKCSGIPLKLVCLFSSVLVHKKKIVKYLINIDLIWLSVTRYKPKLSHGLTCHFMLDRLHWYAKQGIEQACSWASCDIRISPFYSINSTL